jgi:phospholipid/cholesterol/gamma-HCH transport system permease protein
MTPPNESAAAPEMELHRTDSGTLQVRLAGGWRLGADAPTGDELDEELARQPALERLTFDTADLGSWDSSLLTFLRKVRRESDRQGLETEDGGLPDGVRRMLALATASPETPEARRDSEKPSAVARLGKWAIGTWRSAADLLSFVGEVTLAVSRFFTGRARWRRSDLALVLQETGPQALPIVGLLAFLIGLILAYVGATQLERFGAEVYVADLVSIGMAREMGAVMTAILMAGRTGASFAAQLGTMQVNEEIDALKTLGFSEIEFLVLPRLLALWVMMPLLYLYSLVLGILGGGLVAATALDLGALQYLEQTRSALSLEDCGVGLVKATLFGGLVAIAGCLRGIRSGRSSAAVGTSTTSAVVTGIMWVVVADAALDVVFNILGV